MIVDRVSIPYSSMEELMNRKKIIEKKVQTYIDKDPIADRINSNIRVSENKYILEVELIKN